VNSQWSNWRTGLGPALLLALLTIGCGKKDKAAATGKPVETAQAEAELLGREAADLVDRVLAYKSAHQHKLPLSLRQAGLDSLTAQTVRRLNRRGDDPVIAVGFRRTAGHLLRSCDATRELLEDAQMNQGKFEIVCDLVDGGRHSFAIAPPPPPKPAS
jgi:hypothetical protein